VLNYERLLLARHAAGTTNGKNYLRCLMGQMVLAALKSPHMQAASGSLEGWARRTPGATTQGPAFGTRGPNFPHRKVGALLGRLPVSCCALGVRTGWRPSKRTTSTTGYLNLSIGTIARRSFCRSSCSV
jgi:hypothetical protein